MKKSSIIFINIIFLIITAFFLILSLVLNFVYFIPFFFLPLCCWLPFAYRGKKYTRSGYEPYYCPVCGGEIREAIAKYCYHCGAKLHNN